MRAIKTMCYGQIGDVVARIGHRREFKADALRAARSSVWTNWSTFSYKHQRESEMYPDLYRCNNPEGHAELNLLKVCATADLKDLVPRARLVKSLPDIIGKFTCVNRADLLQQTPPSLSATNPITNTI